MAAAVAVVDAGHVERRVDDGGVALDRGEGVGHADVERPVGDGEVADRQLGLRAPQRSGLGHGSHPRETARTGAPSYSSPYMPPAGPAPADSFAAVLFDLDGVLTPTADIHTKAWTTMFDEFLEPRGLAPFSLDDYLRYVDGKPRFDGVRSFLASRDIALPDGDPSDPPSQDSVAGLGNRKNDLFLEILRDEGIAPYPGSLRFLDHLAGRGTPSPSCRRRATPRRSSTPPAWRRASRSSPTAWSRPPSTSPASRRPTCSSNAARRLGVDPADAVVIEDAVSGVAAGRAGDFGLVVGVDRGAGHEALREHGADVVVDDLAELLDVEP